MGEPAPRQPKLPKLRASCDRCGSAKLKCDRQHPECGRCSSLGVDCVYGISRKSNRKPMRVKHSELPKSETPPYGSYSVHSSRQGSMDFRDDLSSHGSIHSDYGSCPNLPNMFGDVSMNDDTTNFMAAVTAAELQDAAAGILPPGLTNFGDMNNFDDWVFTDDSVGEQMLNKMSMPPPVSPRASPKIQRTNTQIPINQTTPHSKAPPTLSKESSGHDCPREACAIWGSLSFDLPLLAKAPASASVSLPSHVPLDHVLRINREACERLSVLLACPCSRSPHLALLYTSIFSRVLIWYQQASGCAQSAPWSPSLENIDMDPNSRSSSASSSGTGSSHSGTPGIAPTQMAMGSFSIDDLSVQNALKIQLISSEMRRAGAIIDLFASQASSGPSSADACSFGGVDSLYRSLSSWLRGEHARTAGIMRSKLTDMSEQHFGFE